MDEFFTILHDGESKYVEKMSRFLGFATAVSTADDAKEFIKKIQNKYHDARHVCWAYMLGEERTEWQVNDNGEPSGSAGKPILGQINSRELTDVCVAVVRYFGGIKLGTGGLAQAYKTAAAEALDDAGKRKVCPRRSIRITFPYCAADGVMRIAKGRDVEIISQTFDNTCEITISVYRSESEQILSRLEKLDAVCADFL